MFLSAKTVQSLEAGSASSRAVYFDTGRGGVPGLCVRVTDTGHRSYWFRYELRGAKHWLPLGDVDEENLSLADAREKATALRTRVQKARRGETTFPHEDLRAVRRAATEEAREITFEKAAEAWLGSDDFGKLRQATRREYTRVTRKLLVPAFGALDPTGIKREEVAALLFDLRDGTNTRKPLFTLTAVTKDREPAGVMANRVRAVLGSFYRWATAEERRTLYGITANPLLGLERIFREPEPTPHVFGIDELRRIFTASAGVDELRHLVPLVAYTLTRSNEARGARWSEFDFEGREWVVPPGRSKDRREHRVPLSEGAMRVLWALRAEQKVVDIRAAAGGFLFPAPTKDGYMDQPQDSIRALRTASGVEDFSLHPMRDTAAHWLVEEHRVRGDVVEDILSHTPTRLERTYRGGRRSSLADMRDALDAWSDRLDGVLGIAKKRRKREARQDARA